MSLHLICEVFLDKTQKVFNAGKFKIYEETEYCEKKTFQFSKKASLLK